MLYFSDVSDVLLQSIFKLYDDEKLRYKYYNKRITIRLKNILNCCKLQIVFKNKTRLGNNFHFEDQIPKDLTSSVVYKFQCGLCNESYYGECITQLNVRVGEHIGITTYQKTS